MSDQGRLCPAVPAALQATQAEDAARRVAQLESALKQMKAADAKGSGKAQDGALEVGGDK